MRVSSMTPFIPFDSPQNLLALQLVDSRGQRKEVSSTTDHQSNLLPVDSLQILQALQVVQHPLRPQTMHSVKVVQRLHFLRIWPRGL
eukprot:scaffold106587_cov15-Tisochrysis_lutea.AAC.1